MATYLIRLVAEDELADFLAVDQHASHGTPMSGRARANFLARLESGRTLAAFDGETVVGGNRCRPGPSWLRSTTWCWPSGPACTPAPSPGGTAC